MYLLYLNEYRKRKLYCKYYVSFSSCNLAAAKCSTSTRRCISGVVSLDVSSVSSFRRFRRFSRWGSLRSALLIPYEDISNWFGAFWMNISDASDELSTVTPAATPPGKTGSLQTSQGIEIHFSIYSQLCYGYYCAHFFTLIIFHILSGFFFHYLHARQHIFI